MSRYIDADKLESELFRDGIAGIFLDYPRRRKYTIGEIRGMLKNERIAPTADVVEVRHGEWKYYECVSSYDGLISGYACSVCNSFVEDEYFEAEEYHKKFCGNCGAKMDGERKDDGT